MGSKVFRTREQATDGRVVDGGGVAERQGNRLDLPITDVDDVIGTFTNRIRVASSPWAIDPVVVLRGHPWGSDDPPLFRAASRRVDV